VPSDLPESDEYNAARACFQSSRADAASLAAASRAGSFFAASASASSKVSVADDCCVELGCVSGAKLAICAKLAEAETISANVRLKALTFAFQVCGLRRRMIPLGKILFSASPASRS
jgi:hypothetical protein